MAGVNESPYTFIGFDNIEKTANVFKNELSNFNSLKPNFMNIRGKDIESLANQTLASADNFARNYTKREITNYDEYSPALEIPVSVESLTSYISNDIYDEFTYTENIELNVTTMADRGNYIIDTYSQSSDSLVNAIVSAMNSITTKFAFLVGKLLSYEKPLEKLIEYMKVANIILILLAVAVFCFLPVYIAFYILRNSSDKYVWMVKQLKQCR